ncbi:MAG: 16S rRNA (cytidine(1402)-2'-O)-methyltransferase [Tissierellia bacterium]|nr:16S rRNA (cytidine(1402)-2'-O)-methyltransferase [Tissierellia bacterium]
MEAGILYICPTPIGNLADITIRALRVLEKVDLIAAEDTRHTMKLLNHYEIKNRLISYHEHNERDRAELLIQELKAGTDIALVTDAGMPGISDPGQHLIQLAIEHGMEVTCLPGTTASITALVLSGLPTNRFVFEGFLSSRRKDRIGELDGLKDEDRTIILYESPHRLVGLLEDLKQVFGNRRLSISRELTKVHEETFRGDIDECLERFQDITPRGEFVLVLDGAEVIAKDPFEDIALEDHIQSYIDEGLSKRDAVKKVAEMRDLPRNLVYRASIDKGKK